MLIEEQKPVAIFFHNYRLKKFFYSNWKQLQNFKIGKFEFQLTVHYGL